jgi:hypothetical protein
MIDVGAVPQRLEDAVAEAERHDVLDRFLAQVMVDAVDLAFVEALLQAAVQFARALQVVPERLFDDDAPPAFAFVQSGRGQPFGDLGVLAGLRREIEEDVAFGLAGLLPTSARHLPSAW